MKKIIFGITLVTATLLANTSFAQNLPRIDKATNGFFLEMDSYDDTPLMFGYEKADIKSTKLICFSTMTADVEGNPNRCTLGSYYSTDDLNIQFISAEGGFVKLKFISEGKPDVIFYMEKKNVSFE